MCLPNTSGAQAHGGCGGHGRVWVNARMGSQHHAGAAARVQGKVQARACSLLQALPALRLPLETVARKACERLLQGSLFWAARVNTRAPRSYRP